MDMENSSAIEANHISTENESATGSEEQANRRPRKVRPIEAWLTEDGGYVVSLPEKNPDLHKYSVIDELQESSDFNDLMVVKEIGVLMAHVDYGEADIRLRSIGGFIEETIKSVCDTVQHMDSLNGKEFRSRWEEMKELKRKISDRESEEARAINAAFQDHTGIMLKVSKMLKSQDLAEALCKAVNGIYETASSVGIEGQSS